MQKNKCNAGDGEGFQVECGSVKELVEQQTEGRAFRCAVELAQATQKHGHLSDLARFRVVKIYRGRRLKVCSPWFYQATESLFDTQ